MEAIDCAIRRFVGWLDEYGETSYDFQSFYAGRFGKRAKALYYRRPRLGTLAVAPIVFCEALVPAARRLFSVPQRFPIADAHYSMAFAALYQRTGDSRYLNRAIHFLNVLISTSCAGFSGLAWGYPFDWVTINGTIPRQTPLITTLPYVYEAFRSVHELDEQGRWRDIMHSIAEHGLRDYREVADSSGAASCTYTPLPGDTGQVVNASAYRAFLLTQAAHDFANEEYLSAAEPNLQFVLNAQNADGSWYYAMDGRREFIDHFHTCFVLKALLKIHRLTGEPGCEQAIARGLDYYRRELIDGTGLPRPFARAPRFVVYRRELYDYAECLNLATLVGRERWSLRAVALRVVKDLFTRWRRPDGSFRSRQLRIGWDNVPMHRWAQAQVFRSLCVLASSCPSAAPTGRGR